MFVLLLVLVVHDHLCVNWYVFGSNACHRVSEIVQIDDFFQLVGPVGTSRFVDGTRFYCTSSPFAKWAATGANRSRP